MNLQQNIRSARSYAWEQRALPGTARPARVSLVITAAKKGGEKKGQKKSALADLMKKKEAKSDASGKKTGPAQPSQYDNPDTRMLAFQMCDSYWRLTKKYLVEGVDFDRLASALYRAPFALLAHNKFQEGVTDPIYIYGNRAALDLFELTWDELVETPSRTSAVDEPDTQKDRNALLEQAATRGVVSGFEVLRVSKSGRRFKIRDGTLFNIMDRSGTKLGQAAVFSEVELADGSVLVMQATPEEDPEGAGASMAAAVPSAEDIAAAEAAVAEQGAKVRAMKEEQGLTNQDIPVQLAVMELKHRKDRLADLKKKLADALAASEAAFDDDE